MADQDSLLGKSPDNATNMAKLVYILYLVGLVVGITHIVGVVIAYIYRSEAPDWVKSHFQLQIRTFWIGLLLGVIGFVTTFIFIGFLVFLFLLIWFVVRCVIGLKTISENKSYPKPETWLW
jgi:uncharacterized membrane protein